MLEILEYLHEKLDRALDRIAELLTGSKVYRVREVKARVPDVRRIADARLPVIDIKPFRRAGMDKTAGMVMR